MICTTLYSVAAWSQTCTPSGNETSAGTNDTWIGYVYDNPNFTSYAGYVTEGAPGNMNFDENFGDEVVTYVTSSCSIITETFSVRYKLDKTFTDGYYSFTVGGDDGYRFSVDGGATWVINQWFDQAYTTTNVVVHLNGLTHLVIEYYENGGGNQISVNMQQVCSSSQDESVYGTNGIWKGYIYDNKDLTFFKGSVTEGSAGNPYFYERFGGDYVTYNTSVCSIYTETFSARYRLQKTFAWGSYTFTVGGDDGYRFSLDGGNTWVINNWTDHSYQTTTYTVTLNGTYNLVIEYYENGGGNIISFDMNFTLLPVELTSFTGKLQNKQVNLQWATTLNSNTDHFTIERSGHGNAFEPLATVTTAQGNTTNTTIQFNYTDATPLTGTSYYRLKITDANGAVSYSDVVTIRNSTGGLKIYPTVVPQQAILYIQAGEPIDNATVTITDLQGRQLQQQPVARLASAQTIGIPLRAGLAKGVYVVQVKNRDNTLLSKTIVIQ